VTTRGTAGGPAAGPAPRAATWQRLLDAPAPAQAA
jgi:hypothetical protein